MTNPQGEKKGLQRRSFADVYKRQVEEIARFCLVDEVYTPCVDFGHVNAREQGSLKTEEDYRRLLEYLLEKLGYERMKHFHVHFSKIMYGAKGEIKPVSYTHLQGRRRSR